MSESKHTPGPWRVDEDTRPGMAWNRHIYGPDGNAVCFMAHSDGKDVERDEANAALIARAPDLAAEVERLREQRTKLLIEIDAFGKALTKAEDERDAERRKVEAAIALIDAQDRERMPSHVVVRAVRAALAASEQKGGA